HKWRVLSAAEQHVREKAAILEIAKQRQVADNSNNQIEPAPDPFGLGNDQAPEDEVAAHRGPEQENMRRTPVGIKTRNRRDHEQKPKTLVRGPHQQQIAAQRDRQEAE